MIRPIAVTIAVVIKIKKYHNANKNNHNDNSDNDNIDDIIGGLSNDDSKYENITAITMTTHAMTKERKLQVTRMTWADWMKTRLMW